MPRGARARAGRARARRGFGAPGGARSTFGRGVGEVGGRGAGGWPRTGGRGGRVTAAALDLTPQRASSGVCLWACAFVCLAGCHTQQPGWLEQMEASSPPASEVVKCRAMSGCCVATSLVACPGTAPLGGEGDWGRHCNSLLGLKLCKLFLLQINGQYQSDNIPSHQPGWLEQM